MYQIETQLEISSSHHLALNYESPCSNIHGHNWIIKIQCRTLYLNSNGMVADFALIKKAIKDELDHKNLNEVLDFNPTAENLARHICEKLNNSDLLDRESGAFCSRVDITETPNNTASWIL